MPLAPDGAPVLAVRGLSKRFGGIQALQKVDLTLLEGEVHGLVGANGAGKSTFMRIIAGAESPDSGEIHVDGRPVTIKDPMASARYGFHFIHQELSLIPRFTARQNMVLGLPKSTRFGFIDWHRTESLLAPVAERLGFQFALGVTVDKLSIADRWLVAIGRALVANARLLGMDEPTASLSAGEVDRLFGAIRELRDQGVTVLYVSHRLQEIEDLCDRATVFKDGRLVVTFKREEISKKALVHAIVGSEIVAPARRESSTVRQEPLLEVSGLSRLPLVHDVSLTLHRGEILGLGGLIGSGRTEVARMIFGADRLRGGNMLLDGADLRPRSTFDAVRQGIAFVPEERRSQGLILTKPVWFNLALATLGGFRLRSWLPFLSMRRLNASAERFITSLGIVPARRDAVVLRLSGGNQQKVVIGKWLNRKAKVLILDEPTRGVDVGARAEIHRLIRELANEGIGVLMIASEFVELLQCDRVIVMDAGRVAGELRGAEISEQAILRLCFSDRREATFPGAIE